MPPFPHHLGGLFCLLAGFCINKSVHDDDDDDEIHSVNVKPALACVRLNITTLQLTPSWSWLLIVAALNLLDVNCGSGNGKSFVVLTCKTRLSLHKLCISFFPLKERGGGQGLREEEGQLGLPALPQ